MTNALLDDTLKASDVAEYLRRHPDFLSSYPELAALLTMPREQGAVASLAAYQLQTLRDKNGDLERKLAELTTIAESLTKALNLDRALFNAELREDENGEFRVVEFSTRVSGGHVYRNIKDVYGIDLVRLFARSILSEEPGAIASAEVVRRAPRTTTCIKRLYGDGVVRRNSVGEAIYEPAFRAYYPMSVPGQVVASAPRGYDAIGALSVWLPWQPGQAPAVVHSMARAIAKRLDVEVDGALRR